MMLLAESKKPDKALALPLGDLGPAEKKLAMLRVDVHVKSAPF